MICAGCNKDHARVARSGDRWLCAGCHAPIVCPKCGGTAAPFGVERHAIGSADSDRYSRPQAVGYRCENGHHTAGDAHPGPAANVWVPAAAS